MNILSCFNLFLLIQIRNRNNSHHGQIFPAAIPCLHSDCMSYKWIIILFLTGLQLGACTGSRTVTVWKSDRTEPIAYNKIMVAVILHERNDSIRADLEKEAIVRLETLGYQAVSSIQEFGIGKLRQLDEEATFLSLCDNGIDAVLTFAEVERSNGFRLREETKKKYTNLFYYQRIWNYRNTQEKTIPGIGDQTKQLAWECILFDLNSLQAQSVLRSAYVDIESSPGAAIVAEQFIQKMWREKVIGVRVNTPEKMKPF